MRRFVPFVVVLLAGCGGKSSSAGPSTVELDFPSIDAQASQEILGLCQSITLNNDKPLYVNEVEMHAGPGWHHSNWIFVPDSLFTGPDGTWNCADRNFDELTAGAQGGVLFAQSTQATGENQQFPPGAAMIVPAHARVIGNIHILNASTSAISTSITLILHDIPESEAQIHLMPMSLTYEPLDIPPHARSRFTASCTPPSPMDFDIYYVLPHYHQHGIDFVVQAGADAANDQTVFENQAPIGSAWGEMLQPPFDAHGDSNFTFSCEYENDTDNPIYWGNADGEMCVLLAYTDSPYRWVGGVLGANAVVGTDGDGVVLNTGDCTFGSL